MKKPVDHKARKASEEPNKSYLVEAGAGSGKTEQLSRRILACLANAEHPEDILAITFTKKSALEMRNRLVKYLKLGTELKPPPEPHLKDTWHLARKAITRNEEMGWDIIKNPSRLNLKTIDSLCLDILNENQYSNGYGRHLTPTDNPEHLYNKAAMQLINCPTDDPNSKLRNSVVAYCGNNSRRTCEYISNLMHNREQWLPHLESNKLSTLIEENTEKVIEAEVGNLQKHLSPDCNKQIREIVITIIDNKTESDPSYNAGFTPNDHGLVDSATLSYFCNIIYSASSNKIKSSFSIRDNIKTTDKDVKRLLKAIAGRLVEHSSLVHRVSLLPTKKLTERQKSNFDNIGLAIKVCAEHLASAMKEEGVIDFTQITVDTLKLLKTPSFSLQTHNKYKHILIDEFQDTSSSHHELVAHLVKEWESTERTLFLVGDPKQSLYLFRSAALGLFLNTKKEGVNKLNLDILELSVNFRSYKSVVDWVNKVFSKALPITEDVNLGAATYTTTTPFSDKEIDDSINYNLIESTGDIEADEYLEAEEVARQILENLEKVPHETNAILIRARSQLTLLDKALKQHNIKYTGIDLIRLKDELPIVDLVNLTKHIIDPNDNNTILGLLRAPFVGITQKQLALILEECEVKNTTIIEELSSESTRAKLNTDTIARITNLLDAGNELKSHRGNIPFNYFVESMWRNLNGHKHIGNLQMVDIKSYFNLLNSIEKHNNLTETTALDKALDKLFVQPPTDSNPLVQIMTIHKAKGLEFPNVFIPCMHKQSTNSSSNLIQWNEATIKNKQVFLVDARPEHGDTEQHIYEYIKLINKQKELLEMTRLAYVATTRAVKRLYMSAVIDRSSKGLKRPSETSLISLIWEPIYTDLLLAHQLEKEDTVELESSILHETDEKQFKLTRYKINEL